MDSTDTPATPPRVLAGVRATELSEAQPVGEVYVSSPVQERSRLLEFLLRPLGVLALAAVALGTFAKIRFRSGWPGPHVAMEDANRVQAADIAALVDRVQQASVDTVDGLATIVSGSPVVASSAAAALLVALPIPRAQARRAAQAVSDTHPDFDPPR